MTVTPAGWYPDPHDAAQLRYWDGQGWSEHTAPAQPPAPPVAEPPAATEPPAFPSYPSYPAADASQPTFNPSTYGQPGYGQPAYGQPGVPNPYEQVNDSNTLSIIGIVCGVIALLFCPPLFGIAGLVLGGVAKSKKERLSTVALIVSAVGLVGGIIIGIAVTGMLDNY